MMKTTSLHHWPHLGLCTFAGVLLLASTFLAAAPTARAGEIIPSVGITRAVHTDDARVALSGGLAFRGRLLPILKSEIGVAYREDSQLGGNLTVRQWPVTASLWLAPSSGFYAGGGVGWYHTTLDYEDELGFADVTHQRFGVHLGGGLGVPLGDAVALDLNGRYVFLKKEESALPPGEFDPDFWTTSVGLAFRF